MEKVLGAIAFISVLVVVYIRGYLKRYNIPKAQLIIADIPFNVGVNAYASNPTWYKSGDNYEF